jgi:hypothetical protein
MRSLPMLALHADDVTNPYSQFALNQYRVDRNEGYKMDQLSTAFGAFIGVVVILDRPAGGNVHELPKMREVETKQRPYRRSCRPDLPEVRARGRDSRWRKIWHWLQS